MSISSEREAASDTDRRFSPFAPVLRFYKLRWLLLDSSVVEVLRSSNRMVVTLASLKALFTKGLLN